MERASRFTLFFYSTDILIDLSVAEAERGTQLVVIDCESPDLTFYLRLPLPAWADRVKNPGAGIKPSPIHRRHLGKLTLNILTRFFIQIFSSKLICIVNFHYTLKTVIVNVVVLD